MKLVYTYFSQTLPEGALILDAMFRSLFATFNSATSSNHQNRNARAHARSRANERAARHTRTSAPSPARTHTHTHTDQATKKSVLFFWWLVSSQGKSTTAYTGRSIASSFCWKSSNDTSETSRTNKASRTAYVTRYFRVHVNWTRSLKTNNGR